MVFTVRLATSRGAGAASGAATTVAGVSGVDPATAEHLPRAGRQHIAGCLVEDGEPVPGGQVVIADSAAQLYPDRLTGLIRPAAGVACPERRLEAVVLRALPRAGERGTGWVDVVRDDHAAGCEAQHGGDLGCGPVVLPDDQPASGQRSLVVVPT